MNITNIPAPRVDFIDARTGLMAREWYRFFLNLFTLVGEGTNAISLTDLQILPTVPDVSSIEEISAQTGQLSALTARYDDLLQKIDDSKVNPAYQQQQSDKYNRVMTWLSTPI